MAPSSETPAAPDVPAPSTATLPQADRQGYEKLTHHLSIWLLVACPTIALLPPRKLDLYTFGLGAMTLVSAEHLIRERSGRSMVQRVSNGFGSALSPDAMPTERARQIQELQRRAKEEREGLARGAGRAEDKGLLRKVWMGDETEGWKERRLREEREAIEQGRGYGGLIMDQIWEVWNWGKRKDGDEKDAKDEVEKKTPPEEKN